MHRMSAIVLAVLAVGCSTGQLVFDTDGFPHGTGWRECRYESGQLMLREYYEDGQLERSLWFRPDGSLIREEDWVDGSGTGIYLREDGTVRTAMPYGNGVAHGMAIHYARDGTVTEVVEFVRGQRKE